MYYLYLPLKQLFFTSIIMKNALKLCSMILIYIPLSIASQDGIAAQGSLASGKLDAAIWNHLPEEMVMHVLSFYVQALAKDYHKPKTAKVSCLDKTLPVKIEDNIWAKSPQSSCIKLPGQPTMVLSCECPRESKCSALRKKVYPLGTIKRIPGKGAPWLGFSSVWFSCKSPLSNNSHNGTTIYLYDIDTSTSAIMRKEFPWKLARNEALMAMCPAQRFVIIKRFHENKPLYTYCLVDTRTKKEALIGEFSAHQYAWFNRYGTRLCIQKRQEIKTYHFLCDRIAGLQVKEDTDSLPLSYALVSVGIVRADLQVGQSLPRLRNQEGNA
jgi:hypothetical protein